MTRFEYLLGFVSILIGLSVADLLSSFHRLVRARRRVRWSWLALAWAALTFLAVVQAWWVFYWNGRGAIWGNFFAFFLPLLNFALLYLLCAAALPEVEAGGEIDLEAFYFQQRGYFFGLLSAYVLSAFVIDLALGRVRWNVVQVARGGVLVLLVSLAVHGGVRFHRWATALVVTLVAAMLALFAQGAVVR
jgi:hypothetical protein